MRRAVACDVSAPSLRKAEARLRDRPEVDFRCGDGLHVLGVSEADVICIAGMGGRQIIRILSERPDSARRARALILSPHRNARELRAYLRSHNYRIAHEKVVRERGHFYEIAMVVPGEDPAADPFWNELARVEPLDEEYLAYVENALQNTERTVGLLEQMQKAPERLGKLRAVRDRIREELQWIRNSLER